MTARQRLIWRLYDFSAGRGLEIGPLHQTAVPCDRADVRYVDVFDRAQLLVNYSDNPGVPCELIPEIDYPLFDGERVRSIPETVGTDVRFDWVMASHVIEHVPDLIGWLDQIAQVTADGGNLVLAVPDRRYCFDLHRPGTTVGQMIQANEMGDTVPSMRAVYDYKRGHASVKAPVIWGGNPPGYEQRIHSLATVLHQVAKARAGEYIDSHVWTFTPGTFLEQIVELRLIGRSEWKVVSLIPTKRDQLEFYAILERLPRGGEWTPEQLAGEPDLPTIPDWLAESARTSRELATAQVQLTRLCKQNTALLKREQARLMYRIKARVRTAPGGAALVQIRRLARRMR
ncbi:MAG: class I SAM-dependent methyltransferase [Jatrophihabitantaceae bacterium]